MLHYKCNMEPMMAKGQSGRIVIEVDPDLKRQLYSALAIDDLTLKDWFIAHAQSFVAQHDRKSSKAANKKQGQS